MAGEIQLNSTTMATESSGTITLSNVNSATNRTNLGLGSMATQNANAVAITGGTINTVQPATGQSLTIKDEDGNTAITIGTDNTAAGYLSLNFGSYHGDSDGAGSGTLTGNTLDDYEEGTFNLTFTASVGVTCTCYYVKIGNTVFFGNDTVVLGVGASTSLTFSGNLPFVANSGGTAQFGLLRTVTNSLTYNIMLAWNKDSSNLYLYQMNYDDISISGDTITKDARTDLYVTFNGFFLTD